MIVKETPADDLDALMIPFSVTDDAFGVQRTHELVPGGDEIMINGANRDQYIRYNMHTFASLIHASVG
jgi:hypothetical protein